MDGYQLTASIVGSLAWPAALLAAIWVFRQRITELLPLLRFKYKDLEASFRLDRAEEEAAALPVASTERLSPPTLEETTNFQRLVEISPRAAIVEARMDVEEAVRSLTEAANLTTPKVQSLLGLTRLLRSRDVIDEHTSGLLDNLRAIGNRAAHDLRSNFTKEDAVRYRDLTNELCFSLGFREEGYRTGK